MNERVSALPAVSVDTTGYFQKQHPVKGDASPPPRREVSPRVVGMIGVVLMAACLVTFVVRTYAAFP